MIRCRCAGTPYFHFSPGSGPCAFKTAAAHHPCLGIPLLFFYAHPWRRKQRDGPRSGAAQTAHSAAGVFAAPQLEALSCRHAAGACRAVPFTPGSSSFLLRQCPQKSVLLSRVWPGWRSDPLCPTLPQPTVSTKCGTSRTATNAGSRFRSVNAHKNLFYCHGCGRGGDLIRFVQLFLNLPFRQSVAHLEQQLMPAPASQLLEQTLAFYQLQLHRHSEAVRYLESRGLHDPTIIEDLGIGYAPGGNLRRHLAGWGYPFDLLFDTGLVIGRS